MPQLSNSFIILERIEKLSKTMHNQSMVMITAPAGYGKTNRRSSEIFAPAQGQDNNQRKFNGVVLARI